MLCLVVLDVLSLLIPSVSLHSANVIFYNDSSNGSRHGSCRLRSAREAVDPSSGRSMTESFVLDDVEYKLCRYRVTWDEALIFCSNQKAHLATIDNDEKASFVVRAIASSSSVSDDYWIGARKYYTDLWSWDSNAKKLSSEMDIIDNIPVRYPGDDTNDVRCLTIDRSGHDLPIFIPRACNQRRGFICQRDNERNVDNKIRMIAASRIGEQEFRLYSGRATWAEAVVQCRQEGLQIGEVNTVEEARALAVTMLRNRPDGIESVWIGGYTRRDDPGTWRWLASGDKIENNDMWQRNLTESSGGCLLLDRHLCEIPVYVETTCDRKRDVLCQKPPKKRLSKKPVKAIVDGCLYWIGFHPETWFAARRSCNSVDASLVVLDSPKTISHMMNLMLDNGAELRHIWTDGRRRRKYGKWQWEVNGEFIPAFGQSFVPWCPKGNDYPNETDCLNLDRENLDSPLVYGLTCNEKQPYVCQPLIGECVSRSSATSTRPTDYLGSDKTLVTRYQRNSPRFYENTKILELSKVTGTLPIVTDNYMAITTSMKRLRDHIDSLDDWKPDDDNSSKDSIAAHNFSQYFSPLSRFSLPSFPQFGIKVASALETTTHPLVNYENRRNKKIKQSSRSSSHVSRSTNVSTSTIATRSKQISIESKKAAQIPLKKSYLSSLTSSVVGHVESTTIASVKTTRNSKYSNRHDAKNLTKNGKTAGSVSPADYTFSASNNENARTKKNSQKTTRDLYSNFTKALPISTKSPDLNNSSNDEKATKVTDLNERQLDVKEFSRNSLIKITTPLPDRRKKLRFTTELTTPYDAIDEDYYKNYETGETTESEDEAVAEFDDYENESYDAADIFVNKRKTKQTSRTSMRKSSTTARTSANIRKAKKKNDKNEKSSLPIARELSDNLQIALMNMMRKSVSKKKHESIEDSVEPTTRILSKKVPSVSRKDVTMEKSVRTKDNARRWSLRPYYAFEGPIIVGLSEGASLGGDFVKIEKNGKSREFKFVGKKITGQFAGNETSLTRGFHENRRAYVHDFSNNKNNVNDISLSIPGVPSIRPNDPNSLMQMGRYFKNKFVNNDERVSEKVGPKEFPEYSPNERNERTRWLTGRHRGGGEKNRVYPIGRDEEIRRNGRRYENSNRYEIATRRLYPRGDNDVVTPLRRQPTKTESWGERLRISWPRSNATNWRASNFDDYEIVSERNFPAPIRTTRSFSDDSAMTNVERSKMGSFPDFKMFELIKEVKIDLDQRLLRNYLEALARKIARKNNARYRKDDWKDAWKYLLERMSKILDRLSVSVNGDAMKVRVGSDETRKIEKIVNYRKIDWMKKLVKRKKDFALRRKMIKINDTRDSSKFNDKRRASANSLEKSSSNDVSTINRSTTDGHKIYTDETSIGKHSQRNYELESDATGEKKMGEKMLTSKSSQAVDPTDYERKTMANSRNFLFNHYHVTARPAVNAKTNFHRSGTARKLDNWYKTTKYPNFNNSRILAAPAIIRTTGISRVYSFQPIMQQLHHRLAFNQAFKQFRPEDLSRVVTDNTSISNGEYLPRGTLSRIVGSEYKSQHYGGSKIRKNKNSLVESSKNRSASERYLIDRRYHESTTNRELPRRKSVERRNNIDEINSDYVYYVNENEKNVEKMDNQFETEIENDDVNSSRDYEKHSPRSIWSASLRLGKAMELSNLRKFRQNPTSHAPTKNLVVRSVKSDVTLSRKREISLKHRRRSDNERGRDEIMRNLENLKDEPSTVSLRMIVNGDNGKRKATRMSRRTFDSSEILDVPRTLELRLKFSGHEKQNYAMKKYAEFLKDRGLYLENISTAANRTYNGTDNYDLAFERTAKLPARFIDKIRRRAMIQKLREKSRRFAMKNLGSSAKRENTSAVGDSRDRKSVGIANESVKNSLVNETSKVYDESREHLPSLAKKFTEKNLTNARQSRVRYSDVERKGRASLINDATENSDQFTLYIDLALGRAGTKLNKSEQNSKT